MTPNQTLVAFGNVLKKITLSLFLVVACNAFAQVGVGTQTPVTSLDGGWCSRKATRWCP